MSVGSHILWCMCEGQRTTASKVCLEAEKGLSQQSALGSSSPSTPAGSLLFLLLPPAGHPSASRTLPCLASPFSPQGCWDDRCTTSHSAFRVGLLRDQIQTLKLTWQHFYPLTRLHELSIHVSCSVRIFWSSCVQKPFPVARFSTTPIFSCVTSRRVTTHSLRS